MSQVAAAPELEADVQGPRVNGIRDWASIRFDLDRVNQFLHLRDDLPAVTAHAPDIFMRNALWDAAVAAYGRCNNSGHRPKIDGLVSKLPTHLRECHQRLMASRDTQVAHHGQPREHRTTAAVVFDGAGELLGVRVRVFPTIGDDDEPEFKVLVGRLAQLVQAKIDRLAAQITAEQDIEALRLNAAPHDDATDGPRGRVRSTYSSWETD